jgi:hypothetical protein
MKSIVLLITVLILLFSSLGIVMITTTFRRMNKEINRLQNQIKNSRSKTKEDNFDQRDYHRINLDNVECYIVFKDFGTKKLDNLIEKVIIGEIQNISVSGIKLITSYDLPVHYHIVGQVTFHLKDEKFDLIGEFVRKESKVECKQFIYGIKFKDLSKHDENRLGRIINEIEVEKKLLRNAYKKA